MKIITSWDDGAKEDLRIAALLHEYDLDGIFFIPTRCELDEEDIKMLGQNFIIGGHTVTHPPDMKRLTPEELKYELEENRNWLKELTGQDISWFCYPKGKYSPETIEGVKNAGFLSARTTLVGEVNIDNLTVFNQSTTVHVYPDRIEYLGKHWQKYAKEKFLEAKELGDKGIFHLWGHSWEVSKFGLWKELEDLFAFIKQNKD